MYSPTTRLLAVLELLQSYKKISGPEMARRLEIDVRTVRRYIVMLQDMGIPVEAERGPYGAYQLQKGYKLPPLMFTAGEAVALSLGLLALRSLRFLVDTADIEGALAKTERVMPETLLQRVRELQETIEFTDSSFTSPPALVMALSEAVQAKRCVNMSYRSQRGDESERALDPYGIVMFERSWYAVGYCHLRREVRTFRLDRIISLQVNEATFERPSDFDSLAQVRRYLATRETIYIEVLLKTSLEQALKAIAPEVGTLEASDAGVVFRHRARRLERAAYYLLMLPFPVKVIAPPELRDLMRTLAAKITQMADDA